jgi:hypothetical protein
MLSQASGSGGPGDGAVARALISGPMSTITSRSTTPGRLAVKYIALRPPIDRPMSRSRDRRSSSTTPARSSKATTAL